MDSTRIQAKTEHSNSEDEKTNEESHKGPAFWITRGNGPHSVAMDVRPSKLIVRLNTRP